MSLEKYDTFISLVLSMNLSRVLHVLVLQRDLPILNAKT